MENIKKKDKAYPKWVYMIQRCYDKEGQKNLSTYKDVEICKEWLCFQNFAEWYYENYIDDFELDKDLLSKKNKIYSPETCCFLPHIINSNIQFKDTYNDELPQRVVKVGNRYKAYIKRHRRQFSLGYFDTAEEAGNAYKIAKEIFVRELAEEWKEKLPLKTYIALINFKINTNK